MNPLTPTHDHTIDKYGFLVGHSDENIPAINIVNIDRFMEATNTPFSMIDGFDLSHLNTLLGNIMSAMEKDNFVGKDIVVSHLTLMKLTASSN